MSDPVQTPAPAAPAPANGAAPKPTIQNFNALIEHNMRGAPAPTARPSARAPAAESPANAPASSAGLTPPPLEPELDTLPLEPDPQAEPEAEYDGDPLDELLHGKAAREILQAIKAGGLPEELLAALTATAMVNGQPQSVTIAEAVKGYQRMTDYTRAKQQAAQVQQQAQRTLDDTKALFDGWSSGEAMLRDLQALGKMEAFGKAALLYATQRVHENRLRETNPEAYRLQQELARQHREMMVLQRQARAQPNPQMEQHRAAQAEQLQALVIPAFAKHGIPDVPKVREEFGANLQALYEPGKDLAQIVDEAAEATAQYLGDLAQRFYQQGPAPANDNPRGPAPAATRAPARNPSPLPGRPGAPASAPRPKVHTQSLSPRDMETYLKGLRRQGR